jgi:hypothetical protein
VLRACFAFPIFACAALAAPVPRGNLPVAPPPHAADPDATLLLVEEVPNKEGSVTKRRLVRIGVRDGRVRPPETVWEGDQRFFSHFGGHQIVRDRFVVTKFGGVIDLREQKMISSEMHGNLDAVEGPLVYYWVANVLRDEGMFTFNLNTHEIHRVAKIGEGRMLLVRGQRSPDGSKSVRPSFAELTLHEGGKSTSLGKGFGVRMSPVSSHAPDTPVVWLGNDRVLAQVKNGELVAVDLKGKQTPVVKIPIAKDPIRGPRLSRDPTGRIVYECGEEAFEVDVKAGTWARIEWTNLGHGFQMSQTGNPKFTHTFRHNGRDIGRVLCPPDLPGRVTATAGHLAVTTSADGSGLASAMSVRVWSAASGEWTTVKLCPNCLVGWAK